MVADIIAGVLVLTVVYILARPQSKAAEAINMLTSAVVAIVKTATDI